MAEEVHDIMALGRSRKKEQMVRAPFDLDAPATGGTRVEFPCVGMYGNGLKSGSMRIADDMLLATVQSGVVTFLLLSRTFLDRENMSDIPVPMPSYDARVFEPFFLKDNPTPRAASDPELLLDQQLVRGYTDTEPVVLNSRMHSSLREKALINLTCRLRNPRDFKEPLTLETD